MPKSINCVLVVDRQQSKARHCNAVQRSHAWRAVVMSGAAASAMATPVARAATRSPSWRSAPTRSTSAASSPAPPPAPARSAPRGGASRWYWRSAQLRRSGSDRRRRRTTNQRRCLLRLLLLPNEHRVSVLLVLAYLAAWLTTISVCVFTLWLAILSAS